MTRADRLALLLCLQAAAFVAARGQVSTGSLSGSVQDPLGTSIPSAKLTARNDHNGARFSTITSDAGLYVFPSLPVGTYTITVEHAGFKKLQRPGIDVLIARRE